MKKGPQLWKARAFYTLAARLPARWHGVDAGQTTARLLQEGAHWSDRYSRALQACLEGKRPVHASELNHPLMMWNAVWRVLDRRLFKAMPWKFRRRLMHQNVMLLEDPSQQQLWILVDLWMQAREQADQIQQNLDRPLLTRLHPGGSWQEEKPQKPQAED